MLQATTPSIAKHEAALPVRRVRIRSSAFWLLLVCEGLLIIGILAALVRAAPLLTPLSSTGDVTQVREAVLQRLNGQISDPLVPVGLNGSAHESNVRGYTLNGQTYYYSVSDTRTADPLGRGAVSGDAIEIVLQERLGEQEMTIYRIIR